MLAKAVYLGNWVANANRDGSKHDPHLTEYQEIADFVFSLAPQFGFSEHFEHDLEYDEIWRKNHDSLSALSAIHDEYDEESFWEELVERLGNRDFHKKYTRDQIKKMDEYERDEKRYDCLDFWDNEFTGHGIERLRIVQK